VRVVIPCAVRWTTALYDGYRDIKILRCPSDLSKGYSFGGPNPADSAFRSYIINGFNDYFKGTSQSNGFPEIAVLEPSATIVFGEKEGDPALMEGHFWMDSYADDDINQIDQNRHMATGGKGGGSNYCFADGSAHYVTFGKTFAPINLWAVDPVVRSTAIIMK
jgi:prepilin-type processing-associated H-X9-DG protein